MGSGGGESTNFVCDILSFCTKLRAELADRAYAAIFRRLHAFFVPFSYFFGLKMSFFALVSPGAFV